MHRYSERFNLDSGILGLYQLLFLGAGLSLDSGRTSPIMLYKPMLFWLEQAGMKRKPESDAQKEQRLKRARDHILGSGVHGGQLLKHAPEQLRGDRDFILKLIKQSPEAFVWASPELQGDREFVLLVVSIHAELLKYAAEELRGDFEVVKAAVSTKGCSFSMPPRP